MPIFMIGTQRSGSNFLRLMLNQSRHLAAPHPPHLISRLAPLARCYEGLDRESRMSAMVEDACAMVNANPVLWYDEPLDPKEALRHCRDANPIAAAEAIYEHYMVHQTAADWMSKSLGNVNYLPQIEKHFRGRERFIYLFRDGRDVALSFQKAVVGEKHVYMIAQQWKTDQEKAVSFWESNTDKVIGIAYESLISEVDKILEPLCAFIGIPYNPVMLEYHYSGEAKKTAQAGTMWGNVTRPVLKGNKNKFINEMLPGDIHIFESVAGDMLEKLRYERYIDKPPLKISEAEAARFKRENDALKIEARKRLSAEDLERRVRQEQALKKIRARRKVSAN